MEASWENIDRFGSCSRLLPGPRMATLSRSSLPSILPSMSLRCHCPWAPAPIGPSSSGSLTYTKCWAPKLLPQLRWWQSSNRKTQTCCVPNPGWTMNLNQGWSVWKSHNHWFMTISGWEFTDPAFKVSGWPCVYNSFDWTASTVGSWISAPNDVDRLLHKPKSGWTWRNIILSASMAGSIQVCGGEVWRNKSQHIKTKMNNPSINHPYNYTYHLHHILLSTNPGTSLNQKIDPPISQPHCAHQQSLMPWPFMVVYLTRAN